jgi:CRP-like cAMP-binding protein
MVVDGQIAIEREVTNDKNVPLAVVNPHECFGEMSLFFHAPRSVSATAIQDSIILQIRREAFVAFARQNPDLLVELNHILSQRLVEAHAKISEVAYRHKPREAL